MRQTTIASLALFAVVTLWGATFPIIHNALAGISPQALVLCRLTGSTLLFLPLLLWKKQRLSLRLLKYGLIFGSLEAGCYLAQTQGLKTISSSESAFITSLSVVIVPFLAPIFKLNSPRLIDVAASLLCLLGIFVLTGATTQMGHLQSGIYWTMLCALCYALSVVYLSKITQKHPENHALVFCLLLGGIPMPLLINAAQPGLVHWNITTWIAIIFCSITTITTYILQSRYQKQIPVSRAAIIYAFEPIFATIFAYFANHTSIHWQTWVGGSVIVCGFLLSQAWPSSNKNIAASQHAASQT